MQIYDITVELKNDGALSIFMQRNTVYLLLVNSNSIDLGMENNTFGSFDQRFQVDALRSLDGQAESPVPNQLCKRP